MLRTALVAAIEPGPNLFLLNFGNADAGVAKGDYQLSGFLTAGDGDAAAGRRVFDGVVQQVREDLAHADTVRAHFAMRGQLHAHGDLLFLGHVFVKFHGLADELAEIHRFGLQFHHAGFGGADVHERVQHVQHAVGFLHAIRQRLARGVRRGAGLHGQFRCAAQTRQRRAQVMRHIVQGFPHRAD